MDNRTLMRYKRKDKACVCGKKIPVKKITEAYMSGKLLQCSECGRCCSAVSHDQVAGSLSMIEQDGKSMLVISNGG